MERGAGAVVGVLEHTVGVLRHQGPVRVDAWAVRVVVLWLFDFWIVDASIARTDCPRLGGVWCGGVGLRGLLFLLSVCETSYEGHMVDALASRADEGRWSLR